MHEEEAVNDSVAEGQEHETQQEAEVQQSTGIRALRQSYDDLKEKYRQKELEIAKKEALLEAMQPKAVPQRPPSPLDVFEGRDDDDVAQISDFKRAFQQMHQELESLKSSQNSSLTPIQKARLNYSDYDKVVSRETVERYIYNPVLQETFALLKEQSPEKAYQYIKYEMDMAQKRMGEQMTQQRVEDSKTRLKSPNQIPNTPGASNLSASDERAARIAAARDQIRQMVRANSGKR